MKIIGITTCGTYYSAWFPYTIASMYPIVDKIVVVNYGYDIKDPRSDRVVPIPRVSEDIAHLDINHKILEIKRYDPDSLMHKMKLSTQIEANKNNESNWSDMRGIAMTHANEVAFLHGAEWILKMDSDQVLYEDCLNLRKYLGVFTGDGLTFSQTEFVGRIRNEAVYEMVNGPDNRFDDSSFMYRAYPGQYYGAGGVPGGYINRIDTDNFHCAHLRSAHPGHYSDKEIYDSFYSRIWFRKYTNQYGNFSPDLDRDAASNAKHDAAYPNKRLSDKIAPKACYYKDPLDYIKMVGGS